MLRAVIVSAALVLLGQESPARVPPSGTPQAAQAAFTIGVLRRDGLVLPFASFDGRKWSASWPADIFRIGLPATLAEIPSQWWGKAGPLTQMTAWLEGGARKVVGLGRPVTVALRCSPQLMLLSDYRISQTALPPRSVFPYPKDGLVVAPEQPLAQVETVPPASKEVSALGLSMLPAFDEAEQRAIKEFTDWQHPIPRMERLRVPLRIEALYRAPMDSAGWTAYYVEAVKQYPPGPDDGGCGLATSAWGWILDGPPGKRKFEIAGRVTYCDRKNVPFMLPFGIIRAAGRAYWVYQFSGTELEGYAVAHPTPDKLQAAVTYVAASCEWLGLMRRGRRGGG